MSEAAKAWGVLVGGVIAYDMLCPPGQTLSEGVDRAMETRLGRAASIGAIAVTALHLVNAIPQKYDPIHTAVEIRRAKLKAFDGYRKRSWDD